MFFEHIIILTQANKSDADILSFQNSSTIKKQYNKFQNLDQHYDNLEQK